MATVKKTLTFVKASHFLLSHTPHNKPFEKYLIDNHWKAISIIRDPRAMCLSMINHVRARPHNYAYNYLFNQLQKDSQRIKAILQGFNDVNGCRGIISLNEMFRSMLAWRNTKNFLTIRFEDLVGSKGGGEVQLQKQTIVNILNHLGVTVTSEDSLVAWIGEHSFGKTGTFRSGQIAGWRKVFSKMDIDLFKSMAGDLLIELGYEKDHSWN